MFSKKVEGLTTGFTGIRATTRPSPVNRSVIIKKMNKSKIAHIIFLPIIFVGSFISVHLPKPFEAIPIILLIVSVLSSLVAGYSAAIRSKRFFQMFHPNPFKQIEASASTYLNIVEKTIVIYALVILCAIISAMIFAPLFRR